MSTTGTISDLSVTFYTPEFKGVPLQPKKMFSMYNPCFTKSSTSFSMQHIILNVGKGLHLVSNIRDLKNVFLSLVRTGFWKKTFSPPLVPRFNLPNLFLPPRKSPASKTQISGTYLPSFFVHIQIFQKCSEGSSLLQLHPRRVELVLLKRNPQIYILYIHMNDEGQCKTQIVVQ